MNAQRAHATDTRRLCDRGSRRGGEGGEMRSRYSFWRYGEEWLFLREVGVGPKEV